MSAAEDAGAAGGRAVPRILIADDERFARRMLADYLGELGFSVVGEAPDGGAAVRMAAALAPDIVLMDVRMPHMDGIEATRRILERDPGVAVVVLSAYEDPGLIESAAGAGACRYLLKGCAPGALSDALLDAWSTCGRGRSGRSGAGPEDVPPGPPPAGP